jgi:hypothetical protein
MNFKCSNGPIRPSNHNEETLAQLERPDLRGIGLGDEPRPGRGHLRIAFRSKKDDTGNKEPTPQAFRTWWLTVDKIPRAGLPSRTSPTKAARRQKTFGIDVEPRAASSVLKF